MIIDMVPGKLYAFTFYDNVSKTHKTEEGRLIRVSLVDSNPPSPIQAFLEYHPTLFTAGDPAKSHGIMVDRLIAVDLLD